MYYTVYRTTNIIIGKIYIGFHKTTNPDDDYLGSGKELIGDLWIYGRENFIKTVLFIFDNELDMKNKEKELVTLEFVRRTDTYNLITGGHGGFDFINRNKLNTKGSQKGGKNCQLLFLNLRKNDSSFIKKEEERMNKLRNSAKEFFDKNPEIRKKAISIGAAATKGSKWISKGGKSKRVPSGEIENYISEGYQVGRLN